MRLKRSVRSEKIGDIGKAQDSSKRWLFRERNRTPAWKILMTKQAQGTQCLNGDGGADVTKRPVVKRSLKIRKCPTDRKLKKFPLKSPKKVCRLFKPKVKCRKFPSAHSIGKASRKKLNNRSLNISVRPKSRLDKRPAPEKDIGKSTDCQTVLDVKAPSPSPIFISGLLRVHGQPSYIADYGADQRHVQLIESTVARESAAESVVEFFEALVRFQRNLWNDGDDVQA